MLHKIAAVLAAFGPLGIFLLSIADSLGVPLPAAMDVLLMTVGAASVRNPRHAYLTALLAVVGSVIGNAALFIAARHGWMDRQTRASSRAAAAIPEVVPSLRLPDRLHSRGDAHRPPALKVFVISAGALRAPFGKFLAVIVVARALRYFGEVYLGIQLEADAQGFLIRNGWTLAGIALGCALAVYATMRGNRPAQARYNGVNPDRGCPNESPSWRTRRS